MANTETLIETLQPFLQQAWKKAAFEHLTSVQKEAIPEIMCHRDVIAGSPTGSGKTLAYLLPVLNQIQPGNKNAQAVILAPSKELVMQILAEIGKWAEGSGIQSASFIGGANLKRQLEKLKKHPQIIVGTPGRMLELIRQKKLKMHEVKTIILDEGDQLLQPEHSGAIAQIIKSTLQDRQLLLFSATLHESAVQKAKTMMKDPALIQIKEEKAIKPVEHLYVVCEARDKVELLRKIARMEKVRALVFMKDRWDVSVVAEKLKFKGIAAGELHSDLRKEEREKAVRLFQNGKLQLLLATDVAARGLDIPTITHVIHFNLAENVSQYVHRSGRTGRLGSTTAGTVLSLVTPREESMLKKYAKERNLNVKKSSIIRGEIVEYTTNNRG